MAKWMKYLMCNGAVLLALGTAVTLALAGEREADLKAIAERMVDQCANIREGDTVLIRSDLPNLQLLENLAVNVRRRGGFPLLQITTDSMLSRMYEEVPARFDRQAPELDLKLAAMADAAILTFVQDDPERFAKLPPERAAAMEKHFAEFYDKLVSRNVRIVGLGNGLYPTAALARQFDISQDKLADIFWTAVNTDYRRLETTGQALRERLAKAKTLRITRDNGTDLTVRIEGRPVFVSDGVISPSDVAIGGAACQAWLPAGEVFLAPVAGTANGTVVVDRHFFRGREIADLRLEFKEGQLTEMTARSGLDPLKRHYDVCGTGKDTFAVIDIGINPDVRIPPDSRMVTWMASGTITVGMGSNTWAGGDNKSEFGLNVHLTQGTLMVDGDKLIEKGVLKT